MAHLELLVQHESLVRLSQDGNSTNTIPQADNAGTAGNG